MQDRGYTGEIAAFGFKMGEVEETKQRQTRRPRSVGRISQLSTYQPPHDPFHNTSSVSVSNTKLSFSCQFFDLFASLATPLSVIY